MRIEQLEYIAAVTRFTVRPLAGDATEVLLVLQHRHSASVARAVRDPHELFVHGARAHQASPCPPTST